MDYTSIGTENGIPFARAGSGDGTHGNHETAGLRSQISTLSNTVENGHIINEIEGVEEAVGDVKSDISSIAMNLLKGQGDINNAITAGNYTTLNSINRLNSDVMAQSNNASMQSLNSFNNLGSNLNQGLNGLGMNMQQGFNVGNNVVQQGFNALSNLSQHGFNEVNRDTNIATGRILDNQHSIEAKMAECCCELKTTMKDEACETRSLMNALELARVTSLLTDTKLALSNCHQTEHLNANNAAQTNVILQHLSPLFSALQGQINNITFSQSQGQVQRPV